MVKQSQIVNMKATFVKGSCALVASRYMDEKGNPAGLALILEQEGERRATVTVNLSDAITLDEGEFCVKGWSENDGIPESLIADGVIVDTGKRVNTGFVQAMVCRFPEAH